MSQDAFVTSNDGLLKAPSGKSATKGLNQNQRHDSIIEYVVSAGSVRIEDLCEKFEVSTMTIHRDLDVLDSRGILRKSRGVVTALATNLFEANPEYRKRQKVAEKTEIAHEAFKLVEPGQALMLDDSTTGVHLAELLPQKQPLTVITNFQGSIDALSKYPGLALISLGGQHYQWSNAFMGSITIAAIKSLRVDSLFMSTPSVIDDICFHQHHDATIIKQAMFDSAEKRYLLLDHGKFSQHALHSNIPLKEFDAVIVDSKTSTEHLERMSEKGIRVIVAEPMLHQI
jgi:DeoR/GlpR family transcriptional regulator of sugar metabolism